MNYQRTPYVAPTPRIRRPRRRRPRKLLAGLVILAAGCFAVQHYSLLQRLDFKAHASSPSSKAIANLSQQLATIMNSYPNVRTGVSVINLHNGEQTNFGSTQPFTAASTTKLVTAAAFLHQVEQGNYELTGTLGDYTAAWQLQQLVQESNNDSWQQFINLLGGDQIQAYAQQIGLSSFNFNNNTIVPSDEALLLEKLYNGELLNKSDTQLLLSYMQNTNDQQLIPAAVPAGATVYHKYGELLDDTGNYVHDAAIILYHGHDFVLTIYTDRTDLLDIQDRLNLIHALTRAVVSAETSG